MSFQSQVLHGSSQPNQLDRDQVYIQHAPDSSNILGIWAGNKSDHRKCVQNKAVRRPGDGNDVVLKPEDGYAAMNTNDSVAQATLPGVEDIPDGHIVYIDDDGGNAGTNNITVATPDDATVEDSATGTISTNDATVPYMYDKANDNWVDLS